MEKGKLSVCILWKEEEAEEKVGREGEGEYYEDEWEEGQKRKE